MSDYVLRERRGATFVITLNRPERRNAFDLEVRQSLAEIEQEEQRLVRATLRLEGWV